tara:strand:+ start:1240 stop:1479 length:240 start_codon:yes stop_codon:yes gene_type:complete
MKNLIIVLLLVFNLSAFSQERADDKCMKITVEKIDQARVKVIKNNTCKNVITVRTYLITEWNKIQTEKRKKRQRVKRGN